MKEYKTMNKTLFEHDEDPIDELFIYCFDNLHSIKYLNTTIIETPSSDIWIDSLAKEVPPLQYTNTNT